MKRALFYCLLSIRTYIYQGFFISDLRLDRWGIMRSPCWQHYKYFFHLERSCDEWQKYNLLLQISIVRRRTGLLTEVRQAFIRMRHDYPSTDQMAVTNNHIQTFCSDFLYNNGRIYCIESLIHKIITIFLFMLTEFQLIYSN